MCWDIPTQGRPHVDGLVPGASDIATSCELTGAAVAAAVAVATAAGWDAGSLGAQQPAGTNVYAMTTQSSSRFMTHSS
jgi:hypothetical protein